MPKFTEEQKEAIDICIKELTNRSKDAGSLQYGVFLSIGILSELKNGEE